VDTFELLPSLAQGELAETSAPELVAAVFRSRASGTLWLETSQAQEIRIYFRAGEMCGTVPFQGGQTLAHVLLANDWVNALDIDSSREEAIKTGKRHGEVLVARGLLTPDQLHSALAAQHTTNLLTLLSLTDGKYDWRGWEPPPAWAREVLLAPVGCIVDALEREQHAPRRAKVLEWLGDHPVRLSVDWADLQGRIALAPMDRRAVSLLALPRQLADFVRASQLEPTRAEAVLVALLLSGAAEPQPGSQAQPADDLPSKPADEDLALAPAPPERQKRLDEREAIARLDALSLDASEAPAAEEELELDLPAGDARVSSGTAAQRDEGAAGSEDSRARDMRKKMLARGIRNLGAMPSRPETEGAVEVTPKYPAANAKEELSADDQRLADDVRSRLRLAPGQNAYARLGVDANASSEAIRNAYLEAAKRFHPDRASSAALASLQAELQTLFALLKEAYEEIATPDVRARYDGSLKSGGRGGSKKEEASILLKMGEVLLKKRDFPEALTKLRRAVDLDATGDGLAALAWCLVSDPKTSAAAKEEAMTLINRALRAHGATARTYYVAGVLWRTKDPESAVDAFRKALEIDPRHQDAALELRLIEQRRKQPAKGGGVLSGLLFGKRKS
jgi:curved DNA-binding protein CbpA